jgi:hypothetical protein
LVLVVGTAGGAFYFTQRLNTASTPNEPASKPAAWDPEATKSPLKVDAKLPQYSQKNNKGDEVQGGTVINNTDKGKGTVVDAAKGTVGGKVDDVTGQKLWCGIL